MLPVFFPGKLPQQIPSTECQFLQPWVLSFFCNSINLMIINWGGACPGSGTVRCWRRKSKQIDTVLALTQFRALRGKSSILINKTRNFHLNTACVFYILWLLVWSGDFLIFFFFMATPVAYGSSQARDWIWATAAATLEPLTYSTRLGTEPEPPEQPEPLQSDS